MGPPPVPSHHSHTITGPDISIPTSWQGPAASPVPSRFTGPIGYSAHHRSYSTEHQKWSKLAYATPGGAMAETISLEISAVHEAGGRKKARGILIGVCPFLCTPFNTWLNRHIPFRISARARRILTPKLTPQASSAWLWRLLCRSYVHLAAPFLGAIMNSLCET